MGQWKPLVVEREGRGCGRGLGDWGLGIGDWETGRLEGAGMGSTAPQPAQELLPVSVGQSRAGTECVFAKQFKIKAISTDIFQS